MLLAPAGPPPLKPPASWRSTVLVLGQRFDPGYLDRRFLRDLSPRSTGFSAALAGSRRVERTWSKELALPAEGEVAPDGSRVVWIDSEASLQILPPVGASGESAMRLIAGRLSLLLAPGGPPPLKPPASWRSTVLVLGQRFNPGYLDRRFLREIGAQTVVAAAGRRGSAMVVAASALGPDPPAGPLGPESPRGAAVRLTWDGRGYRVDFPG